MIKAKIKSILNRAATIGLGRGREVRQKNHELIAQNALLKEKIKNKNEAIKELQKKNEVIKKLQKRIMQKRVMMPGFSMAMHFADECINIADEIKSDVYISHDDLPLTAANLLVEKNGGRIYYDAIEIPERDQRGGSVYKNWSKAEICMLDNLRSGNISHLSGIVTVSIPLAERLNKFKKNVICIENYRTYEEIDKCDLLKKTFGLKQQDKIVLFLNHITINNFFEEVLKALMRLPDSYHLVTLGRITPTYYYENIQSIVKEMNLDSRVHFLEPVPYKELLRYASGADVGIITLDTEIMNNYVSLPNRLFDYISARVPVCSSAVPHIAEIIRHYDIGEIFDKNSAQEIAGKVERIICKANDIKANLELAAKELTWESRESDLIEFLGSPKSATILGVKDLTKNNRVKRIALSLAKSGCKVNVVTTKSYNEDTHKNIYWFHV